jgi:hypothetical protein
MILVGLLLISFALRCQPIVNNSPYPRHVDEETFLKNSMHMLRDGSARPMTLNWPTLPIYMAAAAETAGYLLDRAIGRGPIRSELSTSAFPYYAHPTPVLAAKFLFAALSVAVIYFVALIARKLIGRRGALLLAPAILSANALFYYHSWNYLNVDIVGTFFITGGLAYFVCWGHERETVLHKAVIPGIFCGLAAASKYTHAALALPFLISILANDRQNRVRHSLVLFAVLAGSFALAMPYAILEPERLLGWMARQSAIYSEGWPGYEVDRGIPHLYRQMQHLTANYGAGVFALGTLGLLRTLTQGGSRGLALASYPIVFTLYFSMYRMDLVRNLLAVHVLFAVFASIGAYAAAGWLRQQLSKLPSLAGHAGLASGGIIALVILLPAPWQAIYSAYAVPRDSRLVALDWIAEHMDEDSRIYVARELRFDVSSLRKRVRVSQRPFARNPGYGEVAEKLPLPKLRSEANSGAYFLVPEYGFEFPWPDRAGRADGLNRYFTGGEVVAEFGSQTIPVEYFETVPRGDPKFSIRRGNLFGQ